MNGRPLEPQAEATCRPAVRGENVELTGDEPDRTRTLARQQGRGKATSEGVDIILFRCGMPGCRKGASSILLSADLMSFVMKPPLILAPLIFALAHF